MSNSSKGLLKFITCGSVDDGKSTLIGHILYNSKLIYADQEQALILDSQVGSCGGKIDYSLLLDGLMAEREQGITIDVAFRYFSTDKRSFIVADTPGHEEYTRNMAVGASYADLAIILVDASKGVLVQTRRHMRICSLMGIKYFVFAVNKMDLINYNFERFIKISEEIKQFSEGLGIEDIIIIPVSATEGDNLINCSEKMSWYKGPSLIEYLEDVDVEDNKPEKGFYMPIQRVCRPDYSFRGFQGQIESGEISIGDKVTILPSGEAAVVKSIHICDKKSDKAFMGQPVTIQLDHEVDVSRGCVITHDAGIKTAKKITATLLWLDDVKLTFGMDYWIKIGTKMVPAVVTAINHKIDVNTGELLKASNAERNEIVRCQITLSEEIVLDEFNKHKTLGSFILIDRISHATSACGIVERLDSKENNTVIFTDGEKSVTVRIFDSFYYHTDIMSVLRHSRNDEVYYCGDALPLKGECFEYPESFDIEVEGIGYANIRNGIFIGFGPHESSYPLLNIDGIEFENGRLGNFTKYRHIVVWE